ncbi:TetR/AcrR family transcriptional regulator [Subtercola vilae]|uniref:TetR/AcrR family transcriptional regulator n=1 Tax=Subtercola vilae TaxID=2056433 RepID=A0A4T2C0J4_9MICO|nr:TetR/AcrR family transcriptional regulator [Subtercola vilae]TIH37420.1 TetR/AcrR family transcriptional regulator [Subtercola vilae]
MAAPAGKSIREGSAQKRSAILLAARALFLSDGFDRTSMDLVAAEAGVSKRTVYDYYGDKRTLLAAVVDHTVEALSTAVQRAIDENLVVVPDAAQLEHALVSFAESITVSAIGSSDYAALMRLLYTEATNLPETRSMAWNAEEPEDAVATRFAAFDRDGLLHAPDPRLAADHFVALTISPLTSSLGVVGAEVDEHRVIVEGVRAFLRAYRPF